MTNRVPVKEIGTHTIEVDIHLPSIHVFDGVVLRGCSKDMSEHGRQNAHHRALFVVI